jgi:ribosomal protein S18 acetylase RimI-like enzyme
MIHELDNPVWYSLSETQQEFAIDYGSIRFYHPDFCPFGGFTAIDNITDHLDEYATLVENFFVVGEKPALSNTIKLKKELVCLQMVIENKTDFTAKDDIKRLNGKFSNDLFDLVNLVQPGYFKRKTELLGDYYGIFKNDRLIAVTGERMKMNNYTEVSAVVTHPDHTGKGYAQQLVAYTVNKIFNENKTPCLHVAEINTGAIKLYEKLGFKTRRKISFWNVTK